jgi:hypothetical protein
MKKLIITKTNHLKDVGWLFEFEDEHKNKYYIRDSNFNELHNIKSAANKILFDYLEGMSIMAEIESIGGYNIVTKVHFIPQDKTFMQ